MEITNSELEIFEKLLQPRLDFCNYEIALLATTLKKVMCKIWVYPSGVLNLESLFEWTTITVRQLTEFVSFVFCFPKDASPEDMAQSIKDLFQRFESENKSS